MAGLHVGMHDPGGIDGPDAALSNGAQVEVVLEHQPLQLAAASFHLVLQLGVAQGRRLGPLGPAEHLVEAAAGRGEGVGGGGIGSPSRQPWHHARLPYSVIVVRWLLGEGRRW